MLYGGVAAGGAGSMNACCINFRFPHPVGPVTMRNCFGVLEMNDTGGDFVAAVGILL